MTLNRREAEKGSGDWSPGGFGIVAMRPLCGIQHGGNRKERLRVREAGASAAGRGQRPYASFPDKSLRRVWAAAQRNPISEKEKCSFSAECGAFCN